MAAVESGAMVAERGRRRNPLQAKLVAMDAERPERLCGVGIWWKRGETMRRSVCVAGMLAIGLILCSAVKGTERQDSDDWPMYGRNLKHTFDNPDSLITPNNVAQLQLAWVFPTGDAVTASPAVVDGVVYTGSWDGYFYALDTRSGQLRWKFRLDCQMTVVPIPEVCGGPSPGPDLRRFTTPGGIVTASPAVSDGTLYFAGGKTVYALKASDGTLLWKRVICGRPEEKDCASDTNDPTQVLSSPAVFDGKLFFGADTGGVAFDIPYRGGFVALDARTGNLIWRFEVDRRLVGKGHPSDSSTNPNPFSGLNHFTTARTGGPVGASKAVRLRRGRVPKARGCGS